MGKTTEFEKEDYDQAIASQKLKNQKPKSPGHSIESISNFRNSIPNYSKDPVEMAKHEKEQLEMMKKSGSSKKNKIYSGNQDAQDDYVSRNFQNSRIAQELDNQPTSYNKAFTQEQNDDTKKTKTKKKKKKKKKKS